jgi:chitodextrinase
MRRPPLKPALWNRLARAAAIAALALLALPPLAGANPGRGPSLVQRSGRLVFMHADRADGSSSQRRVLADGLAQLPVRVPAGTWIEPGSRVRLEGSMQDGTLVLADSLTAVEQLAAAPAAAQTTAETAAAPVLQSTAVILFGFALSAPSPAQLPAAAQSQTTANSLVFDAGRPDSLTSYYLEQTYGQIGFGGRAFGPVEIADQAGECGDSDLTRWATKAEAAVGIGDAAYQHYVFVFPPVPACGFTGVAEVSGKHVWVNGDFSVRVMAHELGHNLGLAHAGGIQCTNGGTPAPMGDSCRAAGLEYEDPFDAMGRSDSGNGTKMVRQMSMQHKLELHVVPASAVKVVGVSGSYRLAPSETLVPGAAELLRIAKVGGGSYYVEYRQPLGYFDSQPPAFAGVYLRTESPELAGDAGNVNVADTALIDMHPATGAASAPWSDAAFDLGQVFADPLHGISIQDLAQDASGATLQITMPQDTVAPSAPTGLTASVNGTSAVLSWAAAGDDIAVDHYVVMRNSAGIGVTSATSFSDSGLVPGMQVAYAVAAVDAAGNSGPAADLDLTVPDSTPPTAPPAVRARLTRDGKVHLSWGAATDDGRVAGYRIRRAGRLIAASTGRSYVDAAAKPGSGPTVTYSVVAVDLAGNVGAAGKARPLRAALLRALRVTNLRVARHRAGTRPMVRVAGRLSDPKAVCRVRVGGRRGVPCGATAGGAFAVSVHADRSEPLRLSLRDARGRELVRTLRIP